MKRSVILPGGVEITDVPEGMTQKELMARYKKHLVEKEYPFETEAKEIIEGGPVRAVSDAVLSSPVGRFVSGVADIPLGAMQGLAHISPETGFGAAKPHIDNVIKQREASIARGRAARGNEGFDWARLMGNVGLGVAAGGRMKTPLTAKGRIAQGGLLGGSMSMLQPTEDTENYGRTKAIQGGSGALLGGIFSGGIEAGKLGLKIGKHVLSPLFPSGRSGIRAREYVHAAGDKADDIVAALDDAKQLIPGSRPIAGEAVAPTGAAEFSALQRQVEGAGRTGSKYLQRARDQNAARLMEIRKVSGTETSRQAAVKAREFVSKPFYDAAKAAKIKVDDDLIALTKNDFFRRASKDAKNIADTKGWKAKDRPVEMLHLIKLGIDKQLAKTGDDALGHAEKDAAVDLQKRLVTWIGAKVPNYDIGRIKYAEMSPVINQQRVGHELEKVLTPPISDFAEVGAQRSPAFARALREPQQVIRKSGVQVYDDIKRILTPDQMKRMNNVAEDLTRRLEYEATARAGIKSSPGNIVSAQLERTAGATTLPNALIRPIMIINALLRRMQRGADLKIEEEMAEEMLDPKVVADIMKKAMIPKTTQSKILEAIEKGIAGGTAAAISVGQREVPGAGADALLNAVHPH